MNRPYRETKSAKRCVPHLHICPPAFPGSPAPFNGHELESGYDYTLLYYPDPWPVKGLICLGSDTANEEGNVHIKASVNTGDLVDAKIWLVLSGDVDCDAQEMVGWNPTEYLFEYDE